MSGYSGHNPSDYESSGSSDKKSSYRSKITELQYTYLSIYDNIVQRLNEIVEDTPTTINKELTIREDNVYKYRTDQKFLLSDILNNKEMINQGLGIESTSLSKSLDVLNETLSDDLGMIERGITGEKRNLDEIGDTFRLCEDIFNNPDIDEFDLIRLRKELEKVEVFTF